MRLAAARALESISRKTSFPEAARTASAASAAAIPLAVESLASGDDEEAWLAAVLMWNLAIGTARHKDIRAAGGIAALVRFARDSSLTTVREEAVTALTMLAADCDECSAEVVVAGGPRVCLDMLRASPRTRLKRFVAGLLQLLLSQGQSAALVAVDPDGALEAVLQWHLQTGSEKQDTADALDILADARVDAAAPAPRDFCAGPGCDATRATHVRLLRCAGCCMARYCGEACRDAAWQAHRPACLWRFAHRKAWPPAAAPPAGGTAARAPAAWCATAARPAGGTRTASNASWILVQIFDGEQRAPSQT